MNEFMTLSLAAMSLSLLGAHACADETALLGQGGHGVQQMQPKPTMSKLHHGGIIKTLSSEEAKLSVGQKHSIEFDSNPTTGYSWRSTCIPEGKVSITSEYKQNEASKGLMGAGGIQTFTLTSKEAGRATCTFEYGRSWDESTYGNKKEYTLVITE